MAGSRLLGWAIALGLATACVEAPTAPETLDSDLLLSAAAANPVVASAVGSGHFRPNGEDRRTFSFNAVTHTDGTVTGRAVLKNRAGTVANYQMDVICSRHIGGGKVAVAATVTHVVSSDIVQVGSEVGWGAADNGQGGAAPPDQITTIADLSAPPVPLPPLPFAYSFRDLFCDTTPARALFYSAVLNGLFPLFGVDVEDGNIEVTDP